MTIRFNHATLTFLPTGTPNPPTVRDLEAAARPMPHVVCDWCDTDLGPVKAVSGGPGPDGRWVYIVHADQLDHATTCPQRPEPSPSPEETTTP